MSDSSRRGPTIGWRVILPGIVAAVGFGVIALRTDPPAVEVASRCATAAAVLLVAKLVAWVVRDGRGFHREERLLTFTMFAAIALSWIGAQQHIREVAFNYQVRVQRRALIVSARELSREILSFVQGRRQVAPVRPRPATWDADVSAWIRYDRQTVEAYDRRFAGRVRTAYYFLALRSMRDPDLDAFYERPANDFQMVIVARKLSELADRLAREDRSQS